MKWRYTRSSRVSGAGSAARIGRRGGRIRGVVATRWLAGLAEEFSEAFGGGVPAEGFAGAAVEFGGDGGEVGGRVDGEVGAFGEVLAQQPVGVFVRPALPG